MLNYKSIVAGISIIVSSACADQGPQTINVGKDQCHSCKMTITEAKYAGQLVTQKGRVYKFDDIRCMDAYQTDETKNATAYLADFKTGKFIEKSKATLIKGGKISSPMGGNTQAFANKTDAEMAAKSLGAMVIK